jgi:hypothetical protein
MQLTERLEICLLALANRYANLVVDINEEVLGPQALGADGWTARDMIAYLRLTQPALLSTQADLIINTQESAIYLSAYATGTPALHIHCRGKLPPLKGNVETRQQAAKQLYTLFR